MSEKAGLPVRDQLAQYDNPVVEVPAIEEMLEGEPLRGIVTVEPNPPSGQISSPADALIERRRKWLLDNGDAAESADPYIRGYFNGVIDGLNFAIAIVGNKS